MTELKDSSIPIGICGLVKRDFLEEDVDVGFAFLLRFWGKGYAFEAASAVRGYAQCVLGLKRIVAITSEDNHASAKLLEKLGLHFEGMIPYAGTDEEVRLFAINV
ncbi:RimJ/RimL family protein N-acetyltransferase [Paenibacillus sp. V4I7]|nr:GNAT family N-acetyltransferase [Paenibacillus sp. V4I7]MDQ0899079.1 RimJ/RimL family protein N-acetyltransferase [Paenibacillus sp. V4I7]MDQ0914938.1 RimJ/RimL family protein N-acetyltransferase [Paenibacillus sp. V4I5]